MLNALDIEFNMLLSIRWLRFQGLDLTETPLLNIITGIQNNFG